jgi:very-short-patch-repair endonuclease
MRKYPSYIIAVARDLRKNETVAEQTLWDYLRNRRLAGLKFRRQQHFGRYVVDFYCPELDLAIEVEGKVHETCDQQMYDEHRFAELVGRDLKILRVTNEEVMNGIELALGKILAFVEPEIL